MSQWQARRVAVHEAKKLLESNGFTVEVNTATARTYDIIAWNRDQRLCIVVMSSRVRGIHGCPQAIAKLSQHVQSGHILGDTQLWIYRSPGWSTYRIMDRGAYQISVQGVSS